MFGCFCRLKAAFLGCRNAAFTRQQGPANVYRRLKAAFLFADEMQRDAARMRARAVLP